MRGSYACVSSNVICVITCACCEKLHIGETTRKLADLFTEHLHSIKYNSSRPPVAAYFNSQEHSILNAKVSITTICANDTYRKTKYERLIYRRGTLEPRGMNVRLHFFVSIETP